MSAAEVVFRILRLAQAQGERAGLLRPWRVPAPDLRERAALWIAPDPSIDPTPYIAAAERIVEGALDIFALRELDLGTPPRWNRDPKTGIEAPLVFGKALDYRDAELVGDVKYLWEPNRHLHLVTLAQAYALSGRRRYADALAGHLESWLAACPYGLGPNWSSALEVAIRLVNWSIAWQLLGGAHAKLFEDPQQRALRERWLRSVYEHAEFIRGWFSLHSSANNHLIGEAAGLFIAGLTWPHWPKSRLWRATGKRVLEREALLQSTADGVNREQAVAYQQFVLDFLLLSLVAGSANGERFGAGHQARLEAMLDFFASIMDAGGNVPQFGDADDGCVARLSQEKDFCGYRSQLATGAILFRRGDFKLKSGVLDDKTRWLLGPKAETQFAELDEEVTRLPPRQAFPEGGYYILGAEFDTPREIRVVVDAGPLGYRSIAAHGHADALSFTLSACGRELLVDPGTYAYHTQPAWRRHFRGTSAHNTVRVDGFDQSEQGGNFLWLRKANAGCSLWLSSAEKDSFEGWHDGYQRLADPVRHRRLIELDKKARRVIVEDALEMEQEHDIELFFHWHEDCDMRPADGGFVALRGDTRVFLRLPAVAHARVEVLRGSEVPIGGWVSRHFDCRTPAPVVVWQTRLAGSAVLRTELLVR